MHVAVVMGTGNGGGDGIRRRSCSGDWVVRGDVDKG